MSISNISPNNRDNKGAFKFSGGTTSIINQKEAVEAIIKEMTPDFFALSEIDKIKRMGTKAIRNKVSSTNPPEYISQLRSINGHDCIFSREVPGGRQGATGKPPIYYWLDAMMMKKWKEALIRKSKKG